MRTLAIAGLALAAALALAGLAAADHAAGLAPEVNVTQPGDANTTWRGVAFQDDGTAVLAGARPDGNATRDVLATWTPEAGLDVVYDRPGAGLVDVDVRADGTHLAVGLHDTVLVGEPGAYRNAWDDSRFAQADGELTFYGLSGEARPGGEDAVLAGSSLLRLAPNGSLETLHSGQDAFFRSVAFHPSGRYAFVEAAVDQGGPRSCEGSGTVFGTLWRTDGASALTSADNVAAYGRHDPFCALANSIAHAPNGTFALVSGRDGDRSSMLTWAPTRGEEPADHWQYMRTEKRAGASTCAAWHPSSRYAVTTGLTADPIGLAGARTWTPLVHEGPDLYGCAMHPDGAYALAAGANGTLVRVPHDPGPVPVPAHPSPGSLVPPKAEQVFLVDVIDRSDAGNLTVHATVEGQDVSAEGYITGPWWGLRVNTSALPEGRHVLEVTASSAAGEATARHPFLVNNERFTPETPRMGDVTGLEGEGTDDDGRFTLNWERLDQPVVYEVLQDRSDAASNATTVLQAGDAGNLTVDVSTNGTYTFSVRAKNAYDQTSTWSDNVVVNVAFDQARSGRGAGDQRCPNPDSDLDWPECVLGSSPEDPSENGSTGNETANETPPDDGDRPLPAPGAVLAALAAGVVALARRGAVRG